MFFNMGRKQIVEYLLCLLYVVFLFDPGNNIFFMKLPLFLCIVGLCMIDRIALTEMEIEYILCFLGTAFCSLVIGAIRGGNVSFALGIVLSNTLFLLISVYRKYDIAALELFSNVSLLLCTAIVGVYIVSLTCPAHIINALYDFGNKHVAFTIYSRTYAGLTLPNIYFHSSPMLCVSEAYYCHQYLTLGRRKNLFCTILVAIAFFLTGSRNNMLISIIIPSILILKEGKSISKVLTISFIIGIIVAVLPILLAFFDPKDISNNIKLSYPAVFFAALNKNFINWIIGCGLGTSVYVPVLQESVYITELTYLNCLYWFGIVGCMVIFYKLFKPLYKRMPKQTAFVKIIYGCFLYLCTLNPFLFNSTGITVLSICLYYMYEKKWHYIL